MTVLMVRMIGLVGAVVFVGLLLAGICVVLGALKDIALEPRRRTRSAGARGAR